MYFVNAPLLFKGPWSLISSFMTADTRQRIKVVSGVEELAGILAPETSPAFLGGRMPDEPPVMTGVEVTTTEFFDKMAAHIQESAGTAAARADAAFPTQRTASGGPRLQQLLIPSRETKVVEQRVEAGQLVQWEWNIENYDLSFSVQYTPDDASEEGLTANTTELLLDQAGSVLLAALTDSDATRLGTSSAAAVAAASSLNVPDAILPGTDSSTAPPPLLLSLRVLATRMQANDLPALTAGISWFVRRTVLTGSEAQAGQHGPPILLVKLSDIVDLEEVAEMEAGDIDDLANSLLETLYGDDEQAAAEPLNGGTTFQIEVPRKIEVGLGRRRGEWGPCTPLAISCIAGSRCGDSVGSRQQAGVLRLVFDNSHSMLRSKAVRWMITVGPPPLLHVLHDCAQTTHEHGEARLLPTPEPTAT